VWFRRQTSEACCRETDELRESQNFVSEALWALRYDDAFADDFERLARQRT
jgi:hypothetical protein